MKHLLMTHNDFGMITRLYPPLYYHDIRGLGLIVLMTLVYGYVSILNETDGSKVLQGELGYAMSLHITSLDSSFCIV